MISQDLQLMIKIIKKKQNKSLSRFVVFILINNIYFNLNFMIFVHLLSSFKGKKIFDNIGEAVLE